MVHFTLRQCAYFRAVAENGGISQASRALNISTPSISQAIDKLEALTGLTLFERHHAKGMTLTMQGRLFLDQVIALEALAERIDNEARALALESAGEIRLGAFWTLAPFFMPQLIGSFRQKMPEVTIKPYEMSLGELDTALATGEIDLALTYDLGRLNEEFVATELSSMTPRAFVSASHPLARFDTVQVDAFNEEPYVMLEGIGSHDYFSKLLKELGLSPEISYASTSLETVRSAVAAGLGYTFLAINPPSSSYDGGRLKSLEVVPQPSQLKVILASHEKRSEGAIIKAFRAHAVEYFNEYHERYDTPAQETI